MEVRCTLFGGPSGELGSWSRFLFSRFIFRSNASCFTQAWASLVCLIGKSVSCVRLCVCGGGGGRAFLPRLPYSPLFPLLFFYKGHLVRHDGREGVGLFEVLLKLICG